MPYWAVHWTARYGECRIGFNTTRHGDRRRSMPCRTEILCNISIRLGIIRRSVSRVRSMILNNEFFLYIRLSENTMDCPLSHPYSISNGMKCCRTKECPSTCTNMLKGYHCKDSIVCPHPPCNDHNLGELHMFVASKIFQTEINFFKPFS